MKNPESQTRRPRIQAKCPKFAQSLCSNFEQSSISRNHLILLKGQTTNFPSTVPNCPGSRSPFRTKAGVRSIRARKSLENWSSRCAALSKHETSTPYVTHSASMIKSGAFRHSGVIQPPTHLSQIPRIDYPKPKQTPLYIEGLAPTDPVRGRNYLRRCRRRPVAHGAPCGLPELGIRPESRSIDATRPESTCTLSNTNARSRWVSAKGGFLAAPLEGASCEHRHY